MSDRIKVALTGFMGVGKSSVARHLSQLTGVKRIDLDRCIEEAHRRSIASIIDGDGEEAYRKIETECLKSVISDDKADILSLGGGTWTIPENREMLNKGGYRTVWLEATFEHCWSNIVFSRKERPLARNKKNALQLFEDRQNVYSLADWHFVIRSGATSYDVARQINEEIFS